MDKRLQLWRYNPTAPRNEDGGLMPAVESTYTFIGTVWASIEARPGSERLADKRLQAEQTHEIIVRTSGLTAALRERDQVRFTTAYGVIRTYDILSQIDEDEERRRTRMSARYIREPEDL